MKLALRELRRRPSRFATATTILTLIALLLMFLGGLLDGLIQSSTGAVRAQGADAFVFSEGSRASFLRSRVDPDLRRAVTEARDQSEQVGGLGVVLLGARVPGNGARDLADVALWGYELATDVIPPPPATGTAYADTRLRADGVELNDTLLLGPARTPITVIGWVEDTSFNGQGGLWADLDTWRRALNANRPGASLSDGVVQVLVLRGGENPSAAAARLAANLSGGAIVLSESETIDEIPGVVEQRSTFNQILGVTAVIALVVVALFFALLTVERSGLYGVLKAIGARSRSILAGLVLQAIVVTAIAAAIAGVLVVTINALIPAGSIPLSVSPARILTSIGLMLAAAVIGSAFSLRRVLRVDPASALGGA